MTRSNNSGPQPTLPRLQGKDRDRGRASYQLHMAGSRPRALSGSGTTHGTQTTYQTTQPNLEESSNHSATLYSLISQANGSGERDYNASAPVSHGQQNHILYPPMPGASWRDGLQARGDHLSYPSLPGASWRASMQSSDTNSFQSSPTLGSGSHSLPHGFLPSHVMPPFQTPPRHAGPSIVTDSIASRSIGPSSYQQQNHHLLTKNERAAIARPSPATPRPAIRRRRKSTKQIWIPWRWTGALDVSADGYECKMRKITHFYPPLKIELPSDTPWGAVYNGGAFLPGTGQWEIAQQCAHMDKGDMSWKDLSGCFLNKTSKTHMRTQKRYMGGGSLKPMYLHATSTWSNLPSNTVYIPNPALMMTPGQLCIYQKEVRLYETPAGGSQEDEENEVVILEDSKESDMEDNDINEEDTSNIQSSEIESGHEDIRESFLDDIQDQNMEFSEIMTRSATQRHTIGQSSTSQDDPSQRNERSFDIFSALGHTSSYPSDTAFNNTTFSYGSLGIENTHVTDLLTEKWMEAERIFVLLQKTESMKKESDRVDLMVDLGDLASQFWECFEACCVEDSDAARAVVDDLIFLQRRRQQNLGLTTSMVEQNVCRVLNFVSSLKPYLRFDVELYFSKAAMPDWAAWEKLAGLINDGTMDMQSIIDDENWALVRLREAPPSYAKEEFDEAKIIAMQKTYMGWKAPKEKENISESSNSPLNDMHYKIASAQKRMQQAFDELIVHQISFTGLLEFRRFHSAQTRYKLKVEEGKELQAVQEMVMEVLHSKKIFPDFVVQYSSVTSDASLLKENLTIDAGRLTDRCMGELWNYFFDGSWEYRTVFERPRDAELCHLNSQFRDTMQGRRDVLLAGQRFFLMILKKQRVTRPVTMATISVALGQEPKRESICQALMEGSNNIYIEDYKSLKPTEFKLMMDFLAGKKNTRKDDLEYISINMSDYYIWFSKLSPDLNEDEFCLKVRRLIVDVIFDTLFVKCSAISKVFREGFLSLVNTVNLSSSVSETDKKLVMTNVLKDVTVERMIAFFSAERGITAEEFLSKVDYSYGFPEDLKKIFIEAVTLFTRPETYRLYNFITDEKYNRGTPCILTCKHEMSPSALPQAHTCTKSLDIPYYKDVKTVSAKLILASFSLAYGRV